jgi:hypothetical protein
MSDAVATEHGVGDTAGRHRGEASADEAERTAPHGKHRRREED